MYNLCCMHHGLEAASSGRGQEEILSCQHLIVSTSVHHHVIYQETSCDHHKTSRDQHQTYTLHSSLLFADHPAQLWTETQCHAMPASEDSVLKGSKKWVGPHWIECSNTMDRLRKKQIRKNNSFWRKCYTGRLPLSSQLTILRPQHKTIDAYIPMICIIRSWWCTAYFAMRS